MQFRPGLFALALGALLAGAVRASDAPPEMDEPTIARAAAAWRDRVFVVVADAGPCRVDLDRVVREPSVLFRKRRVGSAISVGDGRGLLTTASVVGRSTEVEIFTERGEQFLATVVGLDPYLDLALLRTTERLPQPATRLHDANLPEPGAGLPCLVLGSAYGRPLSATRGTMGGIMAIDFAGMPMRVHRVEAPIYPGDSGSPVLDAEGRFVGLITAVSHPGFAAVRDAFGEIDLSSNGTQEAGNIGFAVPARECERAWRDLAKFGHVRRGYLGIQIAAGADGEGGVRVLSVAPDGPAARLGILPGDVITTFGQDYVTGGRHLCALVAGTAPQTVVELHWMREGRDLHAGVEIGVARQRPGLHHLPKPGLAPESGAAAATPVAGSRSGR